MESLLKLSGLLNDEDGDRTDLGTLEKRLADQSNRRSHPGTPSKSPPGSSSTDTVARPSPGSQKSTPRNGQPVTPMSSVTSPDSVKEKDNGTEKPKGKEKAREEEVEALSDMMCSLVTNNCGETKYIGRINEQHAPLRLTSSRIFLRILDLLTQRNTMGQ